MANEWKSAQDVKDSLALCIPLSSRHWIGMHGFDPDAMSRGQLMSVGSIMAMDADVIRFADWDAPPESKADRLKAIYKEALDKGDMNTIIMVEKSIGESK